MDVSMTKKTIEERLLKNSQQVDDCLLWQGATNNAGYGMFRIVEGKMTTAHRASYETHIGAVPIGLNICHTCNNKLCINPKHLMAMKHKDNMQKRMSEGRKYCRNAPLKKI
jgi:hypothetical protein